MVRVFFLNFKISPCENHFFSLNNWSSIHCSILTCIYESLMATLWVESVRFYLGIWKGPDLEDEEHESTSFSFMWMSLTKAPKPKGICLQVSQDWVPRLQIPYRSWHLVCVGHLKCLPANGLSVWTTVTPSAQECLPWASHHRTK